MMRPGYSSSVDTRGNDRDDDARSTRVSSYSHIRYTSPCKSFGRRYLEHLVDEGVSTIDGQLLMYSANAARPRSVFYEKVLHASDSACDLIMHVNLCVHRA
jgi:hypothetical protein